MADKTTSFRVRLGDAGTWLRWVIVLVVPAVMGTAALAGKTIIRSEVEAAVKAREDKTAKTADDLEAKVDKVEVKVDAAAAEQKADLQRHEDKMDKRFDRFQDQLDRLVRLVADRGPGPRGRRSATEHSDEGEGP